MPLNFRQIGRDTDADLRLAEGQSSHCLLDKIAEHLLRHHIIGNDAVLKRVNLLECSRRPAQKHACILSDCPDPVVRAVKRCDAWFLEDNTPSAHIDKHTLVPRSIPISVPAIAIPHCLLSCSNIVIFVQSVLTGSSGCPADFFFPHHDFLLRLPFFLLESTIRLTPETITRIQAKSCEQRWMYAQIEAGPCEAPRSTRVPRCKGADTAEKFLHETVSFRST